jgi:alpha-tubulin suppressor-like RCC1 family protein
MFTRAKWMLVVITLTSLCGISSAEMCGRLKAVSCGEVHSLAIADDNSLLSCGSNDCYVLGLGQNISQELTLQRVKGINGTGYLKDVTCFDAGW